MNEPPNKDRANTGRSYSSGFEFVAAVAGFSLIGYWIDSHYGSQPWGLIVGAALGVVGAMYNLIRQNYKSGRKSNSDSQ
jgi:F0F1-type ATP synthase assembly protein I